VRTNTDWRATRGLETQLKSAGHQQRRPQVGKIGAGKSPAGIEARVCPGARTGASLPQRLNRVWAEPITANEVGRHLGSRLGDGNCRQKSKTEQAKMCLEENACLTRGGKKSHENSGKTKIKIWI
jgi:hypothetical protein